MGQETFESHLSRIKGFTSGFDYLRFGLSIAVLIWHSYVITHGSAQAIEATRNGASWLVFPILPMFFALSGFLVASSLQRTPHIPKFLWLRFIRIYPALTVEVLLSAFILGPAITTIALQEYFSSPVFLKYLLNVTGYIHYSLPGVFEANPLPRIVNGSLWTVPFELECYIALASLALLTLTKKPKLMAGLLMGATLALSAASYMPGARLDELANIPGRSLVFFFLAGLVINLNKGAIPRHGALAFTCGIIGFTLLQSKNLHLLSALPIAYLTVWLGTLQPKKVPIAMDGDYSYGIYLYAGPIQQLMYSTTDLGKSHAGNAILSLVLVSLFASFSWHTIEKPALKLKSVFEKKRLRPMPTGEAVS